MFGEISAILGTKPNLTFQCRNYCKVASIKREDYDRCVKKWPQVHDLMLARIRLETKSPECQLFMQIFDRIHIFKDLTLRNARELSLHCQLKKWVFKGPDILEPGQKCKGLYIVMTGVVGAFLKLRDETEFITDYLGPGSFFGQYQMIDGDRGNYGFMPVSEDGALVVSLSMESIKFVAERNFQIRQIIADAGVEVLKNGVRNCDFMIYNGLKRPVGKFEKQLCRLKFF
jgi:hypothetical protein